MFPPEDAQFPFENKRKQLLMLLKYLSYSERKVILSSGLESDFYIDCRQAVLTSTGHFLVGNVLASMVNQLVPKADAVGGVSVGADPLVSATSLMSYFGPRPLNGFYIRKEPKKHGTSKWIEGGVPAGTRVVILEDVVTTGASTIRAIERAKEAHLDVRGVIVLVDRQEENGMANIETTGVPIVTALYKREDFRR